MTMKRSRRAPNRATSKITIRVPEFTYKYLGSPTTTENHEHCLNLMRDIMNLRYSAKILQVRKAAVRVNRKDGGLYKGGPKYDIVISINEWDRLELAGLAQAHGLKADTNGYSYAFYDLLHIYGEAMEPVREPSEWMKRFLKESTRKYKEKIRKNPNYKVKGYLVGHRGVPAGGYIWEPGRR